MRIYQTTPILVKFSRSDSKTGTFSGYAATYNDSPDAYGDVIAPGAFSESLDNHRKSSTRPALLWQHDQSSPIGAWEEFEDTDKGLIVHGRLTLDVQQAQSAYALMKDGALALSIGYTIPDGGASIVDGARLLSIIELHEVSLVGVPANRNARITNVKCFDPDITTQRDFERTARDALGLSSSQAKRLLSGGWSALVRDDNALTETKLAEIADQLNAITNALMGK